MRLALGNGIWAVLFCMLFLYQITDSRKREQKYQSTIDKLTEGLSALEHVKSDLIIIQKNTQKRVRKREEVIVDEHKKEVKVL